MNQRSNVLKSADRLFWIVEHLKEQGGKTVTELSEELDIPKSTVQVYLNTLHNHGFVTRNGSKYEISLRFYEFGMEALRGKPIYPEVKPKVEELASSTGELAASFVEEDGEAVFVCSSEGDRSIRTELSLGDKSGLHCTAGGKAILAHLPDERIREIVEESDLERKTENTIVDPEELYRELAQIREQGYAMNRQESIEGVRVVATPIQLEDSVVGSISVAGPANRFVGERFEKELPETVMGVANEIELNLTYTQSGV